MNLSSLERDKQLDKSFQITYAWWAISVHDLKGICTQVRSRLLDFLLELKDTIGETATESELREKSNSLDAQSMFNSAIFGPNTTILIGHQSSITATQTITESEFAERVRKLVKQVEGCYRLCLARCENIPKSHWQSYAKPLPLRRLTLAACAAVWSH
jgi:hypothetical protein